jgi:hypothetical protein
MFMCTWRNAYLGTKLLGNVCPSSQLDKCLLNFCHRKDSWIVIVLPFLQSDLETPVFMELPISFDALNNEDQKFYVPRLNKSLYGHKQAGYNWFGKLSNGLQDSIFVQSNIDPCIFFGQKCIVLTYVNDCILIGDSQDWLNALVTSLHNGNENFALQDEGSIDKYLGVKISQVDSSSFQLTQPFLIE